MFCAEEKLAVLTTLGCNYCRNTKSELDKAGIKFQEYDLSRQLDVLKKAKELTGQSSVPQVELQLMQWPCMKAKLQGKQLAVLACMSNSKVFIWSALICYPRVRAPPRLKL